MIKYGNAVSNLRVIHAKVPQGSVLGPSMYYILANLPTTKKVTIGTFVNDIAMLAVHENPHLKCCKT